ncbi:MAG: PIG-L family deacetylase [Planctomycetes bacterium]|nr:PIG-L family deacetylase [Planctomycetota bacterium]
MPTHRFPPLADPNRLPRRVVVLAPHPDDEVLGCGGMIAFHALRGDVPVVVFLSDGAAGDPTGNARDLTKLRRDEARAALAEFGNCKIEHFDFPDGELDGAHELPGRILGILERTAAEIVYMPSPLECHADHMAAARAATVAAAAIPGLRTMLYGVNTAVPANELYDISQFRAKKDAALRHYKSQIAFKDLVKISRAIDAARTVNIPDSAGVADCEGFVALSSEDLRDHAARFRGLEELLFPPNGSGESGA